MRLNVRETRTKGKTYTVIVNGEDVSNRCFAFDTVEGWADCYQVDDNGKIIITETFDTAVERLQGTVIIHENPKLSDKSGMAAHKRWVKDFFESERENSE